MSKRPSFQFYPADWLKDPALRRCTKAEKGVWIDMICLMHECEDYGVLSSVGEPWLDREIAEAITGDVLENLRCISELLRKGVARRNQAGAIFCKRMTQDERKRKLCSEAGKRGGNPDLVGSSGTLKGGLKDRVKGVSKGPPKRNPTPSSSKIKKIKDIKNISFTKESDAMPDIPPWLPPEAWQDFLAHRILQKAPMSALAQRKALALLDKLRGEGSDVVEIINASIVNGWKGLFPVKKEFGSGRRKSNAEHLVESCKGGLRGTKYDPDVISGAFKPEGSIVGELDRSFVFEDGGDI